MLLNLDPSSVVFYVGGYPPDFTVQSSLVFVLIIPLFLQVQIQTSSLSKACKSLSMSVGIDEMQGDATSYRICLACSMLELKEGSMMIFHLPSKA